MLDPEAPSGSFGLALCTGHGPLVLPQGSNLSAMSGVMAMPDVSGLSDARDISASGDAHNPLSDSRDTHSLCSFSAAFLSAIASIFALSVLFGIIVTTPFWFAPNQNGLPQFLLLRCPGARAPPAFSG
ncbi:hypothetical protein [Paraburkholderia sp. 35.1]|uniref:hypothetical protein n=1 Tax=unclassified Paraburkholderia TaxID=2615204 RepID=UPI003D2074BC